MSNLETVKAIYEAFGKGDIPFILDQLAETVEWEAWADNTAQKEDVPWLKMRRGKEEVLEFFDTIETLGGVNRFEVLSLLEGGNQVAAEVVIGSNYFLDEEIHLWDFNDDGKIVRMRHYVDTAKHIAAAEKAKMSAAA